MTCRGCLKKYSNGGFCRQCLRELFDGIKVSHQLSFDSPYESDSPLFFEAARISISGVQPKYSIRLEDDQLKIVQSGGSYILKPIPTNRFKRSDQAPANEHLTMQLAKQLFNIPTPANGLIEFTDGSHGYLVKRFDINNDGTRSLQEDFAQVGGFTKKTHGEDYKYIPSYEEMTELMRRYVPTYDVEIEKFFRLLVFNYIFSNGDAHIKNFSITRSPAGNNVLTPAYDLLNTRLHSPNESDMALMLFRDRFSDAYEAIGFYTYEDFIEFAQLVGIRQTRFDKIMSEFIFDPAETDQLIDRSFLADEIKKEYKYLYKDKMTRLKMRYKKPA